MPHFLTAFDKLLTNRRRTGYLALIAPRSFEEQCDEQRRIRDLEDGSWTDGVTVPEEAELVCGPPPPPILPVLPPLPMRFRV